MAKRQLEQDQPIPDTTVFNLHESHKGYNLNKMCNSLILAENRKQYQDNEEAYMTAYELSETEKQMVRDRDWAGLGSVGGNIYYLLKLGFVTGNGLYRMGAQMRGETYEEFLASRNAKGAR